MAQTYTMDEAAGKLGITVDEMKRRLREDWKHIRSLRDGSTLRFKTSDIDELARTVGAVSSDDDLQLEDPNERTKMAPALKPNNPMRPASDDDIPLVLDSGPDFILGDLPTIKTASDSDVRLERTEKSPKVKQDQTESISLEMPKNTGKLGSTTDKLPKIPPKKPRDESEFELTLETDSDEFELSLNPDSSSSEEVRLDADKKAPASGRSGINLGKPADSGLSLEKSKKKAGSSDDIDFQVDLDSSGGKNDKNIHTDSDSEFELNLDESSDSHPVLEGEKGDIFETDFELPALEDDSASEVQALDESADTDLENSDFDLAIEGVDSDSDSSSEESASEVVEVDEEELPKAKKKGKPKKVKGDDDEDGGISFDDMDLDESISASRQLRGVKAGDDAIEFDEDGETIGAAAGPYVEAEWGILPVVLLIPCMFLMFLGGLMGYELLHSMWGYQQPSRPAGILVEGVAKMFGIETKE